jgi:methyl-accepting chemotaxis protein
MTSIQKKLAALTILGLAIATSTRAATPAAQPATAASADGLDAQQKEMLAIANDLSRRCSETMEKWMAANEVTEDQLFNRLYYPIAKTDPPKFNTDWDRLSDRDIQGLEEAALARSGAIVYVVLTDLNGYVPTHNTRYSQTLTGNVAVDWTGNRTKRIFNNHVEIAASRSSAPFIFQTYQRDNGEKLQDVGVPVMVRGRQFGAVRLGFRPAEAP